ncbi:MAG: gluconokinase [Omnitrophica WOR_2 bacterium]
MALPFVIGLDLGTTNCKAAALDSEGRILGAAEVAYTLYSSHPGWVEQDPDAVWKGVLAALKDLSSKVTLADASGISLSGAMQSLLLVNVKGEPLAPAMTWADRRAESQAQELRQLSDSHSIYQRTGCPLVTYYLPARIRWWLQNSPDIVKKSAYFAAIKDWIFYKLTGAWITDVSLASSTGLFDILKLDWDEQALAIAGIKRHRLPDLAPSFQKAGEVSTQASSLTCLPEKMPVAAGASDGILANIGSGAYAPGHVIITVGTSGAIRHVFDKPWVDEQERTWCYVERPGIWVSGGAINNGGLALEWVRKHFYPDFVEEAGYLQLLKDAASVPAGAADIYFLPYFTGERSPYWSATARGLIYGLSLEHTRAHIARAALEGVAFCLADVWDALKNSGTMDPPARLTGGITRDAIWSQITADVLGIPLAAVDASDASVLGAAMVGLETLEGIKIETLAGKVPIDKTYSPNLDQHKEYTRRHQKYQELYRRIEGF